MTLDDNLDTGQAGLERWSAEAIADLVTVAIGLAARRNPLELRAALSQAFNPRDAREQLESFRLQCRRTTEQLRAMWGQGRDVAHLVEEVEKQVLSLDRRIDALTAAVERIEGILTRRGYDPAADRR